jgi:hypothetical protein
MFFPPMYCTSDSILLREVYVGLADSRTRNVFGNRENGEKLVDSSTGLEPT